MKSNFLRRLAQGGGLSLVKLITGLVKIKVMAIALGVDGVGLLSLGLQFQATAVGLVSMSLAVGVINLGRPHWVSDNKKGAGKVLGTALSIVTFNALIFLLGILLVYLYFPQNSPVPMPMASIWPLLVAAMLVSYANVLWEGISFLVDRFDIYVYSNIYSAFVDTVLFSMGAWLYGLKGAFFASMLSSVALIFIYAMCAAKSAAVRSILRELSVSIEIIKPLLSYSLLMLGTTTFGLLCVFLSRSNLTLVAGEYANGYLQVITALAAYMLPFVMTGVWGHLHPIASASGDTSESRLELRRTLVVCSRLGAAACILVVISSPYVIALVYTADFTGAVDYIAVYFIGEFAFIVNSVLAVYLLGIGKKKYYLIGYVTYYSILLFINWLFVGRLGIESYIGGHVIGSIVVFLIALRYSIQTGFLDFSTLRVVGLCALAVSISLGAEIRQLEFYFGDMPLSVSVVFGMLAVFGLLLPYIRTIFSRFGSYVGQS